VGKSWEIDMQRLTAMTLGAALIGLGGLVYDANAQTSAPTSACPTHDVTVYFAAGSSDLSRHSQFTVENVARAASTCGARGVALMSTGGPERAEVVAATLRTKGIDTVIAPAVGVTAISDGVAARAVTLRVVSAATRLG
jgi:hypothetical protein